MKTILTCSFLIVLMQSMTISETMPLKNAVNADLHGQWIIKNPDDVRLIVSRGEQNFGDTITFHKDGKYSSTVLTHDKFAWSVETDSIVAIWDIINREAIEYKYYISSGELFIEWGNNGMLLNYKR